LMSEISHLLVEFRPHLTEGRSPQKTSP
jgi:hypothetical protein